MAVFFRQNCLKSCWTNKKNPFETFIFKGISLIKYEPFAGLEPATCSLRMSCSTN